MQAEALKNIVLIPAFKRPEPSAFLISLVIHLVLIGLLLASNDSQHISIPKGIYKKGNPSAIEVSIVSHAPKTLVALPASAPVVSDDGPLIVKTKPKKNLNSPSTTNEPSADSRSEEGSFTAPESFGFADGVEASGPIGHHEGIRVSERERYLYELRLLIASRKTYPYISKRLGESGQVIVQFNIDKSGKIDQPRLKASSSYPRLNQAALDLVRSIAGFKPFPPTESAESFMVEVPIEYVLN